MVVNHLRPSWDDPPIAYNLCLDLPFSVVKRGEKLVAELHPKKNLPIWDRNDSSSETLQFPVLGGSSQD